MKKRIPSLPLKIFEQQYLVITIHLHILGGIAVSMLYYETDSKCVTVNRKE